MSKYVLVDAISMHRMRYVVEVPDDALCSPEEYAMDTVTAQDAKEFTQRHLDEVISSAREVTLEEAITQYRKDEPIFAAWDDELIIKNHITPIGHSEREALEKEDREFRKQNF